MTELPRQTLPLELQVKLRRLAMAVQILILLGAIGVVATVAWVWIVPGHLHSQVKESAMVDVDRMALHTQVLGGLWTLLPAGIVLLGLQRLWVLFGEYAFGRVFSQRALLSLRGFARCVLGLGLLSPPYSALMSVIVSWHNGPGHRQLSLNISSDDYGMLLFGAALLAISSAMAEAARAAEENAGFV